MKCVSRGVERIYLFMMILNISLRLSIQFNKWSWINNESIVVTSDDYPYDTFPIGKQLQIFEWWTMQGQRMAHKVYHNNLIITSSNFRFHFHSSQVIEKLCLMVLKSLPLLGCADSINLFLNKQCYSALG